MDYDVAIIGGGPAGATPAILLAQNGRRVVVLEREKFPRFRIGESLLPHSMDAFARLGVREQIERAAMPKHGAEVTTACGGKQVRIYFKNGFRARHRMSFQMARAEFDEILLNRARDVGAEVREECSVERVDLRDDGVVVHTSAGELRARYVIDASGRNSVIGQQLGLRQSYAHLKKFSCYAHYAGAHREEGVDGTLTRLVRGDGFWFWMIPLDARRTSVGVVMDVATFRARKLSPEAMLAAAVEETPVMRERMAGAVRLGGVHSAGDYSFRNAQLARGRWMLAGDAAGFIDPIFSTGVFIAIHSGELCAEAIHAVLESPGKKDALFANYEREVNRTMDRYLRFVNAWYRPEFIEVFTSPTNRLQLAAAANATLAGQVGFRWPIWWRMQIFYLVCFLQRWVPLCPRIPTRISLEPKTA